MICSGVMELSVIPHLEKMWWSQKVGNHLPSDVVSCPSRTDT